MIIKKNKSEFCLIALGIIFVFSCSDKTTQIVNRKVDNCHHNTGFVHIYHLVNDKYYSKSKIKSEKTENIPYQKINECFLTIRSPLKKMFVVSNDTLMENSYLVDGCKVSRMPYSVFLKEDIYTKMKFIRDFNPVENDSINNELNKIIDYNFLSEKPYFSEQYLTGNTLDNICSDLVIVQLEILSLIECK